MPLSALIGTRLRLARTALGLRQSDLALRAEISASYLNLIEHNRRRVDGAVLQRLADALGQPVASFHDGVNGALLEDLRGAAAGSPAAPELERTEDFAQRFPGWAQLLADLHQQNIRLARNLSALNDRMTQDPHLSASLHEVISAVASLRSTTGILVETDDLEPEWRARFYSNLAQDSDRLAVGARALVGYLDGFDPSDSPGIAAPQEEVEGWMAAMDWHLAGRAGGLVGRADLASAPARQLAQGWLDTAISDAAMLPDASFAAALAAYGPDPVQIAARLGADIMATFRRIALRPHSDAGLVICDASGTLILRKPAAGFALPRFGAACPLWPLFSAMARPMTPIETVIETPGPQPKRFVARAFCAPSYPGGFHGPELRMAAMLILPEGTQAGGGQADGGQAGRAQSDEAQPVGTTCRTCPRKNCPARREPSILTA